MAVNAQVEETHGIGTAHHFLFAGPPVRINTSHPEYTELVTIDMPEGSYVIIAGLEVDLNSVRAPEEDIWLSPSITCTLKAAGRDLDKTTSSFGHNFFYSKVEVTLKGAISRDRPFSFVIECATPEPDAEVAARPNAIVIMEVDQVIRYQ